MEVLLRRRRGCSLLVLLLFDLIVLIRFIERSSLLYSVLNRYGVVVLVWLLLTEVMAEARRI